VSGALRAAVAASLSRDVDPAVRGLARHLAARPAVAAVLFYGNRLRAPEAHGLADLYVLTEGDAAYHGMGLAALGNRLLPPNVYHVDPPGAAAGKVAVMRLAAFRARMRPSSWDTTLWARFAQPAALLHARDEASRAEVAAALAEAWQTAAFWADRLAADGDRWTALFTATYGAELRVEGGARPADIRAAAPGFYARIDALLPQRPCDGADRRRAGRAWRRRQRLGRGLNALRLAKAAFTFRGGRGYLISKIERHAGPLPAWQRRALWLAAPAIILRLVFRRRPR